MKNPITAVKNMSGKKKACLCAGMVAVAAVAAYGLYKKFSEEAFEYKDGYYYDEDFEEDR